jgi:hypothetical protein
MDSSTSSLSRRHRRMSLLNLGPMQTMWVCTATSLWQPQTLGLVKKPGWWQCLTRPQREGLASMPHRRQWRPLEQKVAKLVRSRTRKGQQHRWWKQQAAVAVEAWAHTLQQPESIEPRARRRRQHRRWERWRLAQAVAPIDPPAATPTSPWPSAHRRLVAARGGASTSRPSSLAATARCWWSRAMVWAAAATASRLSIGYPPLLRAC